MLTGEQDSDANDGIVAAAYAPCELRTTLRGTSVHILEETEYPFRGKVLFTVSPATPLEFPLQLRIPAWAAGATMAVNGKEAPEPQPGSFARIKRIWKSGD
jgi:DUF1680 family protein